MESCIAAISEDQNYYGEITGMVRRFEKTTGRYIEKIIGQDRFAYAHSDTNDFYDLVEWSKAGGYQGSVILFYDFETGAVYEPFSKKRNVVYSNPVYAKGWYYFLQGDYDEKKIILYRYIPGELLEKETELSTEAVELYNLRVIGNPVHVISQDSRTFECYYPERISFSLSPQESVIFMEDGKIYIEKWIEEGWDEEADRVTDQYNYYDKVIVKDYGGNILSEEVGGLYQAADGTWWIA